MATRTAPIIFLIAFLITPQRCPHPPPPFCARPPSQDTSMIIPGFTGSSPVSVSVDPNIFQSTIALSSVYRLNILPFFNRFGRLDCNAPLSVPTRSGFYTSNVSLTCFYTPRDVEIVLGSEWLTACSAVLCDDGSRLEDPTPSVISSLPAGHYWNPSNGTTATTHRAVD